MRRLSLTAAILLLSSAWVLAHSGAAPADQYPGSGSPSAQQPTQPDTSHPSTSGETIEGCLTRHADSFTLTDASGTHYQLAGDTSKLANHVDQQVRITGDESPGAPGAATSGATSGPAGGTHKLFVKKVKMIASSCPSK